MDTSVLPKSNKTLQSTLALRTPRYNGHPDKTEAAKSPKKQITVFGLK